MRRRIGVTGILVFGVLLMLYSLAGCSASDMVLEFGKTTEIEEYAEITPMNVLVSSGGVYAPKGGQEKLGYTAGGGGKEYITLAAKVKNISNKQIKLNSFAEFTLSQGNQEFSEWKAVLLENDETGIKENAVLKPKAEGIVYFIMEANKETMGEASISMGIGEGFFGKKTYKLDSDTNQLVGNYTELGKDRTVAAAGSAEITLKSAEIVERVVPSKAEKWASYKYLYPGTENDVLVDVKLMVKNLKNKPYSAHKLIGIKAVLDGKVLYHGFLDVESVDQTDLKGLDTIDANKTRLVHGVIQIPKKYNKSQAQIFIYMDGAEYCYTMVQE